MGITAKTRKLLWGRAGGRCSRCRMLLSFRPDAADRAIETLGEECHIIAQRPGGPRGRQNTAEIDRDDYTNLILLCANCHSIIDSCEDAYPAERVLRIKAVHESWTEQQLNSAESEASDASATDGEILKYYYGYLDRFAFRDAMRHEEPESFIQAIRDTRVALTTGVSRLSDGTIISRTKGKAWLQNKTYRDAFGEIVDKLREIERSWDHAILKGKLDIRGGGRVSYDDPFLRCMDQLRNEILIVANRAFKDLGLDELPYIPEVRRRQKGWTTGRLGVVCEVDLPAPKRNGLLAEFPFKLQ